MIYQLIHKICSKLETNNIDYMVTGSLALNHYVTPRMTVDLDLVIALDNHNIDRFLKIFDQNYYSNERTIREETNRHGMFNIIDFETGFKIDFIVVKDNKYRKTEFQHKRKVNLGEYDVWIVSPEDLILSKIIWIQDIESEKQKNDINLLLQLNNLDKAYINNWINQLKLKTYNLKI